MVLNSNQIAELKVGGYVDYAADHLGLDSYDKCFSKSYYKSVPYNVSYQFNSLGFRERSVSQYCTDAIVVIGDSFTVGLGLPIELTYPAQLEKLLGHQVLNFGLNGASNEWIARKLPIIIKTFSPKAVIVHYTFSHRRERNEPTWTDDERTLCDPLPDNDMNYNNWSSCHNVVNSVVSVPLLYSFVPNWHPKSNTAFKQVDYARDYFHYGPKTCFDLAKYYADQLQAL